VNMSKVKIGSIILARFAPGGEVVWWKCRVLHKYRSDPRRRTIGFFEILVVDEHSPYRGLNFMRAAVNLRRSK
jgi:hypothetical protein